MLCMMSKETLSQLIESEYPCAHTDHAGALQQEVTLDATETLMEQVFRKQQRAYFPISGWLGSCFARQSEDHHRLGRSRPSPKLTVHRSCNPSLIQVSSLQDDNVSVVSEVLGKPSVIYRAGN